MNGTMTAWISCVERQPPNGLEVMTRIADSGGERNVQSLTRQDNLWFISDTSMYVYYRPTHWREMTADDRNGEARKR